jgi:hypothetical protein
VGKSSFIEVLGKELTQNQGKKIAVLTVDPSSKRTGGMQKHFDILATTVSRCRCSIVPFQVVLSPLSNRVRCGARGVLFEEIRYVTCPRICSWGGVVGQGY